MNKIYVFGKEFETEQYILKVSSMSGEYISAVIDTEKEAAYYFFINGYYKMNNLETVCTYSDLYTPEGKKLSSKSLDSIIEKYFPNETDIIKKRIELERHPAIKKLVNWNIMDFWLIKQHKIIASLPKETKQYFDEIKLKSHNYIETFFKKPERNNKI